MKKLGDGRLRIHFRPLASCRPGRALDNFLTIGDRDGQESPNPELAVGDSKRPRNMVHSRGTFWQIHGHGTRLGGPRTAHRVSRSWQPSTEYGGCSLDYRGQALCFDIRRATTIRAGRGQLNLTRRRSCDPQVDLALRGVQGTSHHHQQLSHPLECCCCAGRLCLGKGISRT